MTEYVYGDILFVINFSMDFLTLFAAGRIFHYEMSTVRLLSAATVGGIYGVWALTLGLSGIREAIATVLSGLVICFIAHYHGNTARFFVCFAVFFGIGIGMGGAVTFLFSYFGKYKTYVQMGGDIYMILDDIPIWIFVVVAFISVLFSIGLGRLFDRKGKSTVCEILFSLEGKEYNARCLVDTGNLLTEPISGTPVAFLSDEIAKELPDKIRHALQGATETLDIDLIRKIRFIPAETVAGKKMVVALVPDRLYVKIGKRDYEPKKAYLAFDEHKDFGGYEGLLPVGISA